MPATKTQTAPALDRALTIMELLARSRIGLTLDQLRAQLGLPRSSVHYLVVTLERRRYIDRNERTGRYVFGQQAVTLTNEALSRTTLRQQTAAPLRKLAERTRLTVHLAVLEQNQAVIVGKHQPADTAELATWIGKRMEVHCTALGKALVAVLPESQLDELIHEHGLARHNEHTLATPRRFKADLGGVLQLGYALDDEEDELGLRCVGCPVLDNTGRVVAAVSVSGCVDKIDESNIRMLADTVKMAAAEVGDLSCWERYGREPESTSREPFPAASEPAPMPRAR